MDSRLRGNDPGDAGALSHDLAPGFPQIRRAPGMHRGLNEVCGESIPPGRTAQPGTDETAISIAAIRRAVSVKCRTSSGLSGRARMSRSQQESHFLRTW